MDNKDDIASMLLKQIQGKLEKGLDVEKLVKDKYRKTKEGKEELSRKRITENQKAYFAREKEKDKSYTNMHIHNKFLDLITEERIRDNITKSDVINRALEHYFKNQLDQKEEE